MEDKARRHLHILDDLTLYQPDTNKQLLGVIQREDTLLLSETKQDTAALLKAWLASSVALEVSPNVFSRVAQMVVTNSSAQATKSSSHFFDSAIRIILIMKMPGVRCNLCPKENIFHTLITVKLIPAF